MNSKFYGLKAQKILAKFIIRNLSTANLPNLNGEHSRVRRPNYIVSFNERSNKD
jgi:hypothetical protein